MLAALSLGNIETISEGGVQRQKYYYDSLNQLIREDNLDLNKTIVYSYDLGGNITSTKEYAYQTGAAVTGTPTTTNTYTYGDSNWKDKLTAYNGNTISYDAIGNPTSYYNGFSFTWQKGRQLASASNGTTSVSYTYNSDSYRTSKTVNGTTTDYSLEGSKVLIEKTGSDYVWFYYDAAGAPVAMATGSGPSLYIYRKNLQGDITGIYSGSTGTLLVSYTYDAWGKVTATNVAGTTESATVLARNPYLYRGYRYDVETGLYYLNSRYYDPETGRFINADDTSFLGSDKSIISFSLFTYCGNNPIIGYDPTGNWNWAGFLGGLAITAVSIVAIATTIATCGAAAPIASSLVATTVTATVALTTSAAVATTGATMMYAAATDSVMVEDVSYSVPSCTGYTKIGASLIFDFRKKDVSMVGYLHNGAGIGKSAGVSHSVGLVENYKKPENYSKHFLDINCSNIIGD